jgi:hypothetical protein
MGSRGRHLTKAKLFWYKPYLIFMAFGFPESYIFSQESSAAIGVSKVGRSKPPSPSAPVCFPISGLFAGTKSASDRSVFDPIRPEEA